MRSILFSLLVCTVAGCSCQPSAGTDAGDEFDAWRQMREVVRRSPDAVPARARALVAAKDALGLFALVRDDVALLPTSPTGFDQAETLVRWGGRATLRGQAGTPRERAELLRLLLTEAGFTAEVVSGAPSGPSTALLKRSPARALSYDAGQPQLEQWKAVLAPRTTPANGDARPLDPKDTVRQAILAQVKPLLMAPAAGPAFDPVMGRVPLVKAVVNGEVRYLNPNVDGAQYGQSHTLAAPEPAAPAVGEHTLKVTLSAARSARPDEPFTLVERTWAASDVSGRTITAAFTAPVSRADASRTRVGDVATFVPMLLVRGEGLEPRTFSAVGTPVTREGALVQPGPAGGSLIDGVVIPAGPTSAAALLAVTALTVNASAIAFPQVEVRVDARRLGGARAGGLAADAFVVKEGGKNVIAALRSDGAGAPRVVLLFDRSSSIPDEFRTGTAAIGHAIAEAIFAQSPPAKVQVVGIDLNRPTAAGPLVGTLAEVDAQLAALAGTGSDVWTALDVLSADHSLTAIVVITDAVADDAATPAILSRLAEGPPVLVAAVGAVDTATASKLAEVSGGALLTAVTAANLPASVTGFLAARGGEYHLVYRAPATGPSLRQVLVSLRAPGAASAMGSYTPPAVPVETGALSALYLTVESGGRSVTRVIAGSAKGTAADREAVAGALFGRFILGVEANPPSFSTLFEEFLDDRLALEPGVDALRSGDKAAQLAASARPPFRVPVDLRFFAAALPDEKNPDDVTFTEGLTVTLHLTRPVLGVKVVRAIDMLPLAPRRTVSFSGGDGYMKTVERTARLAVAETQRFANSTHAQLAGKTLARFDPLTVDTALGSAWAGVAYPAYQDYDVLAPVAGTPVAFWAVHKQTGEVIGVLANGGGTGTGESTEALVSRLLLLLDAVKRVSEGLGYEGVAAWADLEAAKVQALGNAIATFEGEPNEDPAAQIGGNICSAGLDRIAGEIPGLSDVNDVLGDLASISGVVHVGGGIETPGVPSLGEAVCGQLLGD